MIKPLRNESDYDAALKAIERFFATEPEPGSPDADEFDLLALVIGDYEHRHWPIEPIDAPELLQFEMERRGLKQADLARVIGSASRASEIMNRHRALTMAQAWRLYKEWRIPPESLIKPYALSGTKTTKRQ
jgi:HTH-type transcriptional regulator/antitoxin HigA